MSEVNPLSPDDALTFVEHRGIVLERARGHEPSLAEAIAGAPIRGSWWSHPRADAIFQAINLVRESPDVLVSRLAKGKVTYVHSRLWPSLVRVASAWDPARLAWIRQEHMLRELIEPQLSPFLAGCRADVASRGRAYDRGGSSSAARAVDSARGFLVAHPARSARGSGVRAGLTDRAGCGCAPRRGSGRRLLQHQPLTRRVRRPAARRRRTASWLG